MAYFVYGFGFFICTLLLQYILYKVRKNNNKHYPIWTGTSVVIILSMIGILNKNPEYLGAIIGYVTADGIGKELGWH